MKRVLFPYQLMGVLAAAARVGFTSACICGITCIASVAAAADTIAITYSFAGAPIAPPVITGTTATIDGLATGSVLSGDPGLNSAWNPVTWQDHSVANLSTGLLNGSFSLVFADRATLFGNLFEDLSAVATNGGSYPQTLTFTGGTGEFAGATGLVSGAGLLGSTGFTASGSGILNAPAIPEPASAPLILTGLALVIVSWRKSAVKASTEDRRQL